MSLDARPVWEGEDLIIEAAINFQPAAEMTEALARGIDLGLRLEIRAQRRWGPLAVTHRRIDHPVTLSFLPLTEQWQITIDDHTEQFPRRWLMLESLAEPRRWDTGLARTDFQRGNWQLRARARIDLDTLPPAMHLPALFSMQWRLSSPESTWPIQD